TKELWEKTLLFLAPQIKRSNFLTWFQDTAILRVEEKRLTIGVPNPFAKDWLSQKHHAEILLAIQSLLPKIEELEYAVLSGLSRGADNRAVDIKALVADPVKRTRKLPNKQEMRVTSEGVISKFLNHRYKLDNFIIGSSNRLAHAACSAVAGKPGGAYNPLFVYGGVGLGKTHLLQATGNAILKRNSENIVVYVTAERFVNEIVEAIRTRTTAPFKAKYRKVDCLIIDDIQFFANKETTQEEFFHTFNELYDANKQIIISSDRPPRDLAGISDRLLSRFAMGMIVDVQAPDYEMRLAILHEKCREHGTLIPAEVLDFIAFNVHYSVRELEGVLLQAIAQAELEKCTPTVRIVAGILKKLTNQDFLKEIDQGGHRSLIKSSSEVMEVVSDYYKITKSELLGESRRKEIMLPRQVCMYLVRQELGMSYESIGAEFGNRSHTTVIHACDMIIKRLRTNPKMVRDIHAMKKEMGL
ncbi:chromosomal replication initiator protein DnaA, partial [Candidatus Peregrinibacteria bacterium]|nr:chromosomal replication initiator protein DnaA [Candidatus Peregrinibacteria bacterium]